MAYSQSTIKFKSKMAEYFNLNNNEISKELLVNKLNMILDNQGRLVLNDRSITLPKNEPQRSPGFVSPQYTLANSSGEFGLDETSPALSRSSSNSTFDSGDNEATIGTSLQCTSKEFDRETFLTELWKSPSIWCKKHPDYDYKQGNVKVNAWNKLAATFNKDGTFLFNPLSAKFIKWSNTLKQIVGKLPTICLSVFDHFSGLALKGLRLLLTDSCQKQ